MAGARFWAGAADVAGVVDVGPYRFRSYLDELGLAERTARQYAAILVRVDAWCEERGHPLATLPAPVAVAYADTLPWTRSSRIQLRTTLRYYWEACGRLNAPVGAIRVPKRSRMTCQALSREEALLLSTRAQLGDRAGVAVLLGLYQALRKEEIATVRWEDFSDDGWLKVVGKGSSTAKIPAHPIVTGTLDEFRSGQRADRGWLFAGGVAGHVNSTTVWTWVKKVAADAGVEDVWTHRLRHTALATAHDATRDLHAVRDFARHASVRSTAGYTRTTDDRLRAVVAAIDYSAWRDR